MSLQNQETTQRNFIRSDWSHRERKKEEKLTSLSDNATLYVSYVCVDLAMYFIPRIVVQFFVVAFDAATC